MTTDRGDRGQVSLQVLGALIVVLVTTATLVAVGLPERLGCEIEQSTTRVIGGTAPDCNTSGAPRGQPQQHRTLRWAPRTPTIPRDIGASVVI